MTQQRARTASSRWSVLYGFLLPPGGNIPNIYIAEVEKVIFQKTALRQYL